MLNAVREQIAQYSFSDLYLLLIVITANVVLKLFKLTNSAPNINYKEII